MKNLKILIKNMKNFKKYAITTPIFSFCEVIAEIYIPLLLAKLIDYGITPLNLSNIYKYGTLLLAFALIALVFAIFSARFAAISASGFVSNIRKNIFYTIQNFSFENLNKFSIPSLITRLTTDMTNIQVATQSILRIATRSPIIIIFASIMVFKINRTISFMILFIIPILSFFSIFIILKVHPIFIKVLNTFDKLNKFVRENLRAIRVVKSFSREKYEYEKFKNISQKMYHYFVKASNILSFNMPLILACTYLCILFIYSISPNLIISSKMTVGQLMSLINYMFFILNNLILLSTAFVLSIISKSSIERATEVLSEKINIKNPENPIYTIKNGNIEFKNVYFKYSKDSKTYDLKNINLKINSGDTIGIIGETGSAKTTLVSLIPRLYDPLKGEVLVGDINVKNYDLFSLRQNIAIVLQKNLLFLGTIKENLLWGNEHATYEEIKKACDIALASEFIDKLPNKYNYNIEQSGNNLSGGQKQRLCIARALLMNPKILILDDSMSALDSETDTLLRKNIEKYSPKTTKIIISQKIISIKNSTKIIIINNNEISDIGNHDYLLKHNDFYKKIYEAQMKEGHLDDEF